MPWKANTIIEARREFLALAHAPGANVRALCRQFGVSANTAYEVLNRFRSEGDSTLVDKSRRPHSSPWRTPEPIEIAVLAVRDEFPLWGARRIAHRLKELGHTRVPAVSTTTEILRRHGRLRPRKDPEALQWMSMLTTKRLEPSDLPEFEGIPDLTILLERLQNGRPIERKRCAAILANRHGLRGSRICQFLNLSPAAYRRCLEVFAKGGVALLFAGRINPHRKFDNDAVKQTLFSVLHQPPSNFGINRTTWTMRELSRVMNELAQPAARTSSGKL